VTISNNLISLPIKISMSNYTNNELNSMVKEELLVIAMDRGIPRSRKMRKEELVSEILSSQQNALPKEHVKPNKGLSLKKTISVIGFIASILTIGIFTGFLPENLKTLKFPNISKSEPVRLALTLEQTLDQINSADFIGLTEIQRKNAFHNAVETSLYEGKSIDWIGNVSSINEFSSFDRIIGYDYSMFIRSDKWENDNTNLNLYPGSVMVLLKKEQIDNLSRLSIGDLVRFEGVIANIIPSSSSVIVHDGAILESE